MPLKGFKTKLSLCKPNVVVRQWRAVTSETGHATGTPKTSYAIGYFMGG